MAGPQHDASLGDHGRCPEGKLVGAEQRGDQHVPAGHEAAVDPDPHPVPQTVGDQRLLGVGQSDLPRHTGVLDRRQRTRTGPSVRTRDVNHVRQRLRDSGGDEPNPELGNELHRYVRLWVRLFEVEDYAEQILARDVKRNGAKSASIAGAGGTHYPPTENNCAASR